ncbi:MAG: alpha/beta fold hydrolase [Phototrophicaceae bacterium]
MGKKLGIGILSVIIILIIGYYGIGYYVFNILTDVSGGCGQPFMVDMLDNQPDNFRSRYTIDGDFMDVSAYQMPIFDEVSFSSRGDDATLAAWFIPAVTSSDNVIIIVHGINGCRREPTQLIPAGMLVNNGFNVLMIDLRNHGDSEITNGRLAAGNIEFRDVLGAIDYLNEQGYANDKIGLMGISLGAASATIAFAEEATLPALFLDSPFSSIEDMVEEEFTRNGYPLFLMSPAFQIAVWNGIDFYEYSPNTAILNHQDRAIQIVHGEADTRIPIEQAIDLYELAGANAELIRLPDLEHVEAIYNAQDIYEELLVSFFTEALNSGD